MQCRVVEPISRGSRDVMDAHANEKQPEQMRPCQSSFEKQERQSKACRNAGTASEHVTIQHFLCDRVMLPYLPNRVHQKGENKRQIHCTPQDRLDRVLNAFGCVNPLASKTTSSAIVVGTLACARRHGSRASAEMITFCKGTESRGVHGMMRGNTRETKK